MQCNQRPHSQNFHSMKIQFRMVLRPKGIRQNSLTTMSPNLFIPLMHLSERETGIHSMGLTCCTDSWYENPPTFKPRSGRPRASPNWKRSPFSRLSNVFIVRSGNNALNKIRSQTNMDYSRLASWKLSNWSPFSRLSLISLIAISVLILIQDSTSITNLLLSWERDTKDLGLVSASAIKCWVCRSDGDPKCADPFDNTSFPITDCKQEKPREHLPGLESTMCRKVRQKGIDC